ncbi:molecular chaperone GroES [Candidatus Saccharibacteria bacterium CG_4_10_14_0_2_um_filter_52_9]|nr:MAG: molecular chaperone GroES [Candidatus Saccharibacteria bacterium CG_4_10_14_0_2_um_filter_52_9]
MSSPLQPLGDYIVAVGEEAATKTASGLYLPEQAQEKPKTAKVMATGPNAKQVKVGDRIVYKSYSTTDVKVGTQEYILVKEEDVLATVK